MSRRHPTCSRAGSRPGRAALAAAAVAALLSLPMTGLSRPDDPYRNLPAGLTLTGVIRDFRERGVPGGHPDFERKPEDGFGVYMGMVRDTLDADGKPLLHSRGRRVTRQWQDGQGRNRISNRPYIAVKPGDRNGGFSDRDGAAVTSAATFAQWFRDTPGLCLSAPLSITLQRQPGSTFYVFDDTADSEYSSKGGFFPIDGELLGNSGGSTPHQNFHFTYQLDLVFLYQRGGGQVFTFTGDDDVWVFVDGKLVIDLGGVHAAVSQTIELDRLTWLKDGGKYSLKLFLVERHRAQSNCRIETNIRLENVTLPATSAPFD